METQVRTPQAVFNMPQRLVVPLFQRPYVWNQENQWEPLWSDVILVTERLLAGPAEKQLLGSGRDRRPRLSPALLDLPESLAHCTHGL